MHPTSAQGRRLLAVTLLVAAVSAAPIRAAGSDAEDQGFGTEARREADAPLISFIDSPTATCYQDMDRYDTCYVGWNYMQVTAGASQYIIRITVELDGRMRAYYAGFFQTDMYVPSDLNGRGLKVACGELGAGGDPDLGSSYSYVIRAAETGGLTAANYGTVFCPAMLPWQGSFEDGFESGDTSAWSAAVR